MSDEEMVERQFKEHGFLAEDIQLGINFITSENNTWFSLLRDLNHTLQKMVVAGAEKHHGSTLDSTVLATFSGIRSLGNLQAAILTLERGMVAEARIMIRCLFENAFCIAALAESPEDFIPMLRHDNLAAKRGQARALKDGSYSLTKDVQAVIEDISNGKKGEHLNWKKISDLSSIKSSYLFYKHLSDDSSHYSASSLNRYLVTDRNTNTWSGYNFGPRTKEEVTLTANLCASAALSITVGYSQVTADSTHTHEINSLLERYSSINNITPKDDEAAKK
ncbi:DUF5677 domain-containing protein [Pseudomonas syringae]|uniref:DUF5677 domain-containing protein n=1 Tax=Pseudomonas syringae TaxID=317 RepID=UPI001F0E6C2C|nr:DUF5677 domain-containing protein [Pseudomonas syringae]MCH5489578.1 DUF5677 domain-containing protein [Pseudomonas syringae pv. syringae]MDO1460325.1 DUF5677 domain-containing protein [Pseudomonas syringae pv. syringae]